MGEEPIQAGCRGTKHHFLSCSFFTIPCTFLWYISGWQAVWPWYFRLSRSCCTPHWVFHWISCEITQAEERGVGCFNRQVLHILVVWAQTLCHTLVCSEESSIISGVGADQLLKDGKLECCKNGPIFWVDAADTDPCIGNCVVLNNNF